MRKVADYCKKVKKNHLKRELVMTREHKKDFGTARKYICNESYNEKDFLVRNHCYVTVKYRGSAHQSFNLVLKLA